MLVLLSACESLSAPKSRSVRLGSTKLRLVPSMEEEEEEEAEVERQLLRPTLTEFEVQGPEVQHEKPKIVVLGASGRIGRLVVQQLMERKDIDMTVIAFVRDLGKANWALFDEMLVPRYVKKKGPELQLVLGDLVPPQEMASFTDREEEKDWKRRATSASKYFGNKMKDYDNREYMPESNEALEEAISGASTIISCVGAVRLSNVWTDYICFWRLFRHDVSKWCRDPKHPYYVHYESTRKALDYAEREQLKQDQARRNETEVDDDNRVATKKKKQAPDRIRFIRISDLVLSKNPYTFIPVFTNMIQSMVFRYQDMAERVLEESSLVDTVILRPGDLTDADRDTDITHLQVCESGKLPYPAVVGREDVASLAVAAALFQTENVTNTNTSDEEANADPPPFHMNLAVRWCGELDPPHAGMQGNKNDGTLDAYAGLQKVLFGNDNLRRKRKRKVNPSMLRRFAQKLTRRRLKPYAIFVAVPVYIMLALVMSSFLPGAPGSERLVPVFRDRVLPQIRQIVKDASSSVVEKVPDVRRWISWRSASAKYITI